MCEQPFTCTILILAMSDLQILSTAASWAWHPWAVVTLSMSFLFTQTTLLAAHTPSWPHTPSWMGNKVQSMSMSNQVRDVKVIIKFSQPGQLAWLQSSACFSLPGQAWRVWAPWHARTFIKEDGKYENHHHHYPQPLAGATCAGARGPRSPGWPNKRSCCSNMIASGVQTRCSWNCRIQNSSLKLMMRLKGINWIQDAGGGVVAVTLYSNIFCKTGKRWTSWAGEKLWNYWEFCINSYWGKVTYRDPYVTDDIPTELNGQK